MEAQEQHAGRTAGSGATRSRKGEGGLRCDRGATMPTGAARPGAFASRIAPCHPPSQVTTRVDGSRHVCLGPAYRCSGVRLRLPRALSLGPSALSGGARRAPTETESRRPTPQPGAERVPRRRALTRATHGNRNALQFQCTLLLGILRGSRRRRKTLAAYRAPTVWRSSEHLGHPYGGACGI